ncbi:hypothetical protein IE077_003492, partial [Cardiosporidium cionae]
FAEKLEAYGIAEWAEFYIRYKVLKKFLKRHRNTPRQKARVAVKSGFSGTHPSRTTAARSFFKLLNRQPENPPLAENLPNVSSFPCADDSLVVPLLAEEARQDVPMTAADRTAADSSAALILDEFLHMLDDEIQKVEDHFMSQKQLVLERLMGVESEIRMHTEDGPVSEVNNLPSSPSIKKISSTHRQSLQKALVLIWKDIDNLDAFVNMNIMAVYKILKKRDKLLNIDSLSVDLASRKEYLAHLTLPPEIENKILDLFQNVSDDHSALSGNMKNFHALFQKDILQRNRVNSSWISFFLGAILVCIIDIGIIAWIPTSNPTFALDDILTILPIYRFVLMIVLFLWGVGAAMSFMDTYGVNY